MAAAKATADDSDDGDRHLPSTSADAQHTAGRVTLPHDGGTLLAADPVVDDAQPSSPAAEFDLVEATTGGVNATGSAAVAEVTGGDIPPTHAIVAERVSERL